MLRKSTSSFLKWVFWLTIAQVPLLAFTPAGAAAPVVMAHLNREMYAASPAANPPVDLISLITIEGRSATPSSAASVGGATEAPHSENTLRIDGSREMQRINEQLKQRYESRFPDTKVTVTARGTEAALEALLNEEIDLAAISRSLTPQEKAQGLIEIPIAQEKIAILIGRDNPFRGALTVEQLAEIFQGTITDWSDVGGAAGPIRVIDRPDTSETRLALSQYGILPSAAQSLRLRFANRVQLDTDDTAAVIRELGSDGISYAIADQLPEDAAVRLVKIAVLQETLPEDARYPYVQQQSYAFKAASDSAAQSFLSLAIAPVGQTAIATAKRAELQAIVAALAAPMAASLTSEPLPAAETAIAPTTVEPRELQLPPQDHQPVPPAAPDHISEPMAAEPVQTDRVDAADQVTEPTTADTTAPDREGSRKVQPSMVNPLPENQTQPAATHADAAAVEVPAATSAPDSQAEPTPKREPTASRVIKPVPPGKIALLPAEAPVAQPIPVVEPGIVTAPEVLAPVSLPDAAAPSRPLDSRRGAHKRVPLWLGLGLPVLLLGGLVRWLLNRRWQLGVAQPAPVPPGESGSRAAPPAAPPPATSSPAGAEQIDLPAATPRAMQPGEETAEATWVTAEELAPPLDPESTGAAEVIEAVLEEVSDEAGDATEVLQVSPIDVVPVASVSGAPLGTTDTTEVTEEIAATEVDTEVDALQTADAATEVSHGELPAIESATADVPELPESADLPKTDLPETIETAVIATPPPVPPAGVESLQQSFLGYLQSSGKTVETATPQERYTALAQVVCDQLLQQDLPEVALAQPGSRLVIELSAEYMPGPHLANHLLNLGISTSVRQTLQEMGLDLDELLQQEAEPGLGKGGLGRLMSCYLDSLATANVPAIGYGIRYQYGIFDQDIRDGWQVEIPGSWLRYGSPWERERPEAAVTVGFGGHSEAYLDEQNRYCVRWLVAEQVTGIPYDTPVSGYRTGTVNLMRLWKTADSQQLCQVLYPVDVEQQGKEQRLKQQFFLVSCAMQDVLRLHLQAGGRPDTLPERMAIQLNDTDPTLAVVELMRLLLDQHQLPWEQAWAVTQRSFAYTNHSLLPETLDDCWTLEIFGRLLPRHLEIIFEINNRFLDHVRSQYPNDPERVARMSLIDERGERYVRTTYLACVGSHSINGVSQLHTQLLQSMLLRDFYELYPQKFSNKTNGVSPRRFLLLINPQLADLICHRIGDGWITHLSRLRQLEPFVEDAQFRSDWRQVKQTNKQALAAYIRQHNGIEVDVNSLFDVHTMRLHEYKRQHLNVLHILTLYRRLKANPALSLTPRTFIFAGKAAPDYFTAKLMIRLIHAVAQVINSDPDVNGRLKVVFIRNYNIKVAQTIYPAADLAEYISLAGTEACSTGNLIYAMNGSLIMGTPDGSNLELRDAVGAENFFEFGLTVSEVASLQAAGYQPSEYYQSNADLKAVIDLIESGALSAGDRELFRPLVNLLLYPDQYKLLADYAAYVDCQDQVGLVYQDSERWTRMSILNTARIGQFSSDRAIRDYCQEIWRIESFAQPLPEFAPT
ncbi:MAG: glycogen/starch/alpha-glucan family phosphorylase [Synechococcales cyanobacterium C42_A2020_086]|jgi:starch phosphorylase|nr:glycogen/starch/alpha-glucan family phosphorylase [Synechococcales cyanobacterium C42_A2020_086]